MTDIDAERWLKHLPLHDECAVVTPKDRTALQQFIYEHEPAGVHEEEIFRGLLSSLCAEIESEIIKRVIDALAVLAEEEQLNLLKLITAIRSSLP